MKGGDHQTARFLTAERLPNPFFHLTRCLVGKRHRRNMPGLIAASADQVGDFIGNYASFTRTRSCQHQAGSGDEFDSVLLAGI
ncbi:Uncharacterised protein [Salmonella enterica subsp. enterica serovar Typhimurium str. DT104]|nr:Uncharacterised protein [Salmonella enterica subsp. enterica serovar Typhimurium str. DT104]